MHEPAHEELARSLRRASMIVGLMVSGEVVRLPGVSIADTFEASVDLGLLFEKLKLRDVSTGERDESRPGN